MEHKISVSRNLDKEFILLSATLETTKQTFWIKIPIKYQEWITELSDPWLNILAFPMMCVGGTFYITGTVSASLIDNIEMFANIWSIWCPDKYKPIKIVPEQFSEGLNRADNNKIISAFSGGLDAAYTAYKYKNNLNGVKKYDLDAAIMIHGADIPLSDTQQFDRAFQNAKNMTDDLDIELIPVKTNYRENTDNWSFEFGSVISGILSLFSNKYATGVAASDDSVHNFELPWGTNPVSDHYLKSDIFNFISDGYQHTRTQRAEYISQWRECLDNLRVCWRNDDKSKNCGKCVRTKLNFMAVGVHHLPTMPNDLTAEELLDKNLIKMKHNIIYFEEILNYASKNNTLSDFWFDLLKSRINCWKCPHKKRHRHSFWWHVRHLKF